MNTVVSVSNITKAYHSILAVSDISFDVHQGEIFGILGPNGAGKTTTIEIMEGLRRQDKGEVRVLGFDPRKGERAFKEIIGVQLQRTAVFRRLKVWEVVDFFGSFFEKRLDTNVVLDVFQLRTRKDSYVRNLSGGEMQRLSVALAFVNDPQILFLDEPTTGMDPQTRRDMWKVLEAAREREKTVILTTHYMEEAEKLCDRVAIVDSGEIVAMDAPRELIKLIDASKRIEFRTAGEIEFNTLKEIEGVDSGENSNGVLTLYSKTPEIVLSRVFGMAADRGFRVEGLRVLDPSLEDVYLKLTGKNFVNEKGTKSSRHRN